jgi:CRISPR-associated protein (TIGR02584 family)
MLRGQNGFLRRFCDSYGIDTSTLPLEIELVTGKNGEELPDIRTKEENELCLSQLVNLVKKLTSEEENNLFASMAGGRKTMGIFLSFAMELFARKNDSLTHVLISPSELESSPDFGFLPNTETFQATTGFGENKTLKTFYSKDIQIEVEEVPFFRMRQNKKLFDHYKGLENINKIREVIQTEIDTHVVEPEITLDLTNKDIEIRRQNIFEKVHLPPQLFAVYYFLLSKGKFKTSKNFSEESKEKLENFIKEKLTYQFDNCQIVKDQADLTEKRSKICGIFKNKLDEDFLKFISIDTFKGENNSRLWEIKISPEKVSIRSGNGNLAKLERQP